MTRRSIAADQTHALARVATDLASLRREVTDLAVRTTELSGAVAAHGRALEDLTGVVAHGVDGSGAGSDVPLPRNATSSASEPAAGDDPAPAWLTVADPALAVGWLNELSLWVPAVWQPYLQTKTPECWPWHPAVVGELLVVWQQWTLAVLDGAGPDLLAAWHDRWRPGAAARLARLMAGCERSFGRHKIRGKEYAFDLACLDEVAEWWATTHGTDRTRPVPGLTFAPSDR